MTIQFKQVSRKNIRAIKDIHSLAYPAEIQIWNQELLANKNVQERLIGQFSFLLYIGKYAGHCLAFVDNSFLEPESGHHSLFIADMAVCPELQGRGYGRVMAQEIIRRAAEANVNRIEFCARELTTFKAIQYSTHARRTLDQAGFVQSELGRQPLSESAPISEHGRLIVLQKLPSKIERVSYNDR